MAIFNVADYGDGSLSLANVELAIAAASAGDTVYMHAGTATWTDKLEVFKMITLRGAGKTQTVITNNRGVGGILIDINLQATGRFHLESFGINGQETDAGIQLRDDGSTWREFVVRDMAFTDCDSQAIEFYGTLAGVASGCTFTDCDRPWHFLARNQVSWDEPPYIGSTKSIIVEDNTVLYTASGNANLVLSSGGQGMRRVLRYNDVTYEGTGKGSPMIDTHGNQCPVEDNAYSSGNGVRGSRVSEIYGNTFSAVNASGGGNLNIDMRGGICLIYDNVFIGEHFGNPFAAREEDSSEAHFTPALTTYPGYDMHHLYLWGNTVDGVTDLPTAVKTTYPDDTTQIVEGTNLFLRAPESGDAAVGAGGAGDGPTTSAQTQAIYPLPQLEYPHPWLVPAAPTDLTLTAL